MSRSRPFDVARSSCLLAFLVACGSTEPDPAALHAAELTDLEPAAHAQPAAPTPDAGAGADRHALPLAPPAAPPEAVQGTNALAVLSQLATAQALIVSLLLTPVATGETGGATLDTCPPGRDGSPAECARDVPASR